MICPFIATFEQLRNSTEARSSINPSVNICNFFRGPVAESYHKMLHLHLGPTYNRMRQTHGQEGGRMAKHPGRGGKNHTGYRRLARRASRDSTPQRENLQRGMLLEVLRSLGCLDANWTARIEGSCVAPWFALGTGMGGCEVLCYLLGHADDIRIGETRESSSINAPNSQLLASS